MTRIFLDNKINEWQIIHRLIINWTKEILVVLFLKLFNYFSSKNMRLFWSDFYSVAENSLI